MPRLRRASFRALLLLVSTLSIFAAMPVPPAQAAYPYVSIVVSPRPTGGVVTTPGSSFSGGFGVYCGLGAMDYYDCSAPMDYSINGDVVLTATTSYPGSAVIWTLSYDFGSAVCSDGTLTANPCTVPGPHQDTLYVSANFVPMLLANTPSGGYITSGTGMDCGAIGSGRATCEALGTSASAWTFTAHPDPGYTFSGWSFPSDAVACANGGNTANPCEASPQIPTTATATFASLDGTTQTITVTPPTSGYVTAGTEGAFTIDCGAVGGARTDCSDTATYGSSYTLTAHADPGSVFRSWDGVECDAPATVNPCVFAVGENPTVSAAFGGPLALESGVSLGGDHSCYLDAAGKAWCWGSGSTGALGDGVDPRTYVASPVAVDTAGSLPDVYARLSAGSNHTCALTPSGEAWCWGSGTMGQLGEGGYENSFSPVRVNTFGTIPDTFVAISAGGNHTCALTATGQAWCWGWDQYGSVGEGAGQYRQLSPVRVDSTGPLPDTYTEISAGTSHTCGLDATGAAWCWGIGLDAQLGDGSGPGGYSGPPSWEPTVYALSPVAVSTTGALPDSYAHIYAGMGTTCALESAGTAWCWGRDGYGELGDGDGSASGNASTPVAVDTTGALPDTYASLALGAYHACGMTSGGAVRCWGATYGGVLGDGSGRQADDAAFEASPVAITTAGAIPDTFAGLDAGSNHTCAVSAAQTLWCWGADYEGQLGNGPGITADLDAPGVITQQVIVNTPTGGTVAGDGLDCGGEGHTDCTAAAPWGGTYVLTATADTGKAFVSWSGVTCTGASATSSSNPCTIATANAATVTATFATIRTLQVEPPGSGTITGLSGGIDCGPGDAVDSADCTESVLEGESYTLTATPATGYAPNEYTWKYDCAGQNGYSTCTFTVDADPSVGAQFAIASTQPITVTPPTHGYVTSGSVGSYTLDCGPSGSGRTDCTDTATYGGAYTIVAHPDTNYAFDVWGGGATCSGTDETQSSISCTFQVGIAPTVTASFVGADQTITVTPPSNGYVTGAGGLECGSDDTSGAEPVARDTCTATAAYGSSYAITAHADSGYSFSTFGGDLTCATALTDNPCTFTVGANPTVTATFAALPTTVELSVTPSKGGVVTSSPSGIDCAYPDAADSADCTEDVVIGDDVVLTAVPDGPSSAVFVGWSDNCTLNTPAGEEPPTCTVTMSEARTVTATFGYVLTVAKNSTTAGTITSSPVGISCDTACETDTQVYAVDTEVTLTSTLASADYQFREWSANCTPTGTARQCTVDITQAWTVSATYAVRVTISKNVAAGGEVSSTPSGILCRKTCAAASAFFVPGATVSLTAVPSLKPAPAYAFVNWASMTGGWACSGGAGANEATTCSFSTPTAPITIAANFGFPLTVTKAAGAASITSSSDWLTCDAACTSATKPAPSGTLVVLTAALEPGYRISGWTGCTPPTPTSTTCGVSMTAPRTVAVTFVRTYALSLTKGATAGGTVTSSPAGISCDTTCASASATYDSGTSVTLTASAATGYSFTGWSGTGAGSCTMATTCTFTMSADRSITATFTLNRYALTVSRTGTGTGANTVSLAWDPSGSASCDFSTTCVNEFDHGTSVTLTANPSVSSTFTGWSGAGCESSGTGTCTVSMTQARSVNAIFTIRSYALDLTVGGTGPGTIASDPVGISCSVTCSANFDHGTSVVLTATPGAGTSVAWSGDCTSSTATTCTVSMTQARSVTATFTIATYALTVSTAGAGTGTVTSNTGGIACPGTCSATYDHGTVVTLTAAATSPAVFVGWSGCVAGGTPTVCTVTVDQAWNVTATFGFRLSVAKNAAAAGTVTSNPVGISCGTSCTSQAADYQSGTVTLTAVAATGYAFLNWTGACTNKTTTCSVTMSQARTVTAVFGARVSLTKTGAGAVTSSPTGLSCGKTCTSTSGVFAIGTSVTLTTTLPKGTTTATWTISGITSTGLSKTVAVNGPVTVSVVYS